MKKTNKVIVMGVAFAVVIIVLLFSFVIFKSSSKGKTTDSMLKNIKVTKQSPVKAPISLDDNTLFDELPEITKYPLAVEGKGDVVIEIMTSPEKAGQNYESWLIDVAEKFNEEGYTTLVLDYNDKITDQGKERFQTVTFPFISQFRIDFWRMRLLANAGAFASYRFSSSFSGILPTTITSTTKKFGYGFVLGGGLAFVFRPFELHFEANYKYNLSNLYDKTSFYGNEYWISTHTNQLILSVGLFTRIGGSAYKVKENSPYYKSRK